MEKTRMNDAVETLIRVESAPEIYRDEVRRLMNELLGPDADDYHKMVEQLEYADHLTFKNFFKNVEKDWNVKLRECLQENTSWTTHRRRRKGERVGITGEATRIQILLRRPITLDYDAEETGKRVLDIETKHPSLTLMIHGWPKKDLDLKQGTTQLDLRLIGSPSFFEKLIEKFGYEAGPLRFKYACQSEELDKMKELLAQGETDAIPNHFANFLSYWF